MTTARLGQLTPVAATRIFDFLSGRTLHKRPISQKIMLRRVVGAFSSGQVISLAAADLKTSLSNMIERTKLFRLVISEAQEIPQRFLESDEKLSEQRRLASALAQMKGIEENLRFIDKTLEDARATKSFLRRLDKLKLIASSLTQTGDKERALLVINEALNAVRARDVGNFGRVPWELFDIETLSEIASSLAPLGDMEQALMPVIDEALNAARKIKGTEYESAALSYISIMYLKAGNREKALEVARLIPNYGHRSFALSEVALSFAQLGDMDKAQTIINEALHYTKATATRDLFFRSMALHKVAEALAQIGDTEKALEIAKPINDHDQRSAALSVIAVSFAKMGNAEKALEVARAIKHDVYKTETPRLIATTLAQRGDTEKALEVARSIYNYADRSAALSAIAPCLAQKGDMEIALTVIVESLDYAKQLMKATAITWTLHKIAESVTEMEAMDNIQIQKSINEVLNKALRVVRESKDPQFRLWELLELAKTFCLLDPGIASEGRMQLIKDHEII